MIARVVVRSLGFVIVRGLLVLVGLGPAPDAKDVEIAVPRHQLAVLGPRSWSTYVTSSPSKPGRDRVPQAGERGPTFTPGYS